MVSHKELRELMLICYADNTLSDEENLIFLGQLRSVHVRKHEWQ